MVRALAFSPDGRRLASGAADQRIVLWDVESGEPWISLSGQNDSIWSLAFSPDGQVLAAAGETGNIRLWRAGPTASH
jgi:WD40 repeat protein